MVLKNPDLPATSGCRHLSAVEVIGTGLLAWCLQHETDHLKGVIFGDRLSTQARRRPTVARRSENSPAGDIAAA
jgi:peptide deformylase